LYPLWNELIEQLIDAAANFLTEEEAATCRQLAARSPDEVIEILRRQLGTPAYRAVLREALRVRTDPVSGRSWTAVQEIVCRCAFKGVVTTNYDPGIVDARVRVRLNTSATGFTSWTDELGMDRWRTGDIYQDFELPVLFAHGHHNQPDAIVLATTEYRRAYEGKLAKVLSRMIDSGHVAWIGFSFADQRISSILREIAQDSGTRADPGSEPRHIALMPWDPDAAGNEPKMLAQQAEISYNARLVLYPAPNGDHSALQVLLAGLTDKRFSQATGLPASAATSHRENVTGNQSVPAEWVPGHDVLESFTGRTEELARLDRWIADPDVNLIAVNAWGGAGKTALVNYWVQQNHHTSLRPAIRGVFGWDFYADSSAENWADALLKWAQEELNYTVPASEARKAPQILRLLREMPLLLVLDGLEVRQEGPVGDGFGRLLDGTLREVLVGTCRVRQPGLICLTSRFPFADLESFDGSAARILEVPPFTISEGTQLLDRAGGGWLDETTRRELVRAVDGHALAVWVLGSLLDGLVFPGDIWALQADLATATRTDARVRRVLQFYANRLTEPDRYLVAALSLFTRPVHPTAILAVAEHEIFSGRLTSWTRQKIEEVVHSHLAGLVTQHSDGTMSAHPLVRDTFRPLAIGAAHLAVNATLTDIPSSEVTDREAALRVTEAIELLLDASAWPDADGLYSGRVEDGMSWRTLPAARLGQRTAAAFSNPPRRTDCIRFLGSDRLAFYFNETGLLAAIAGDMTTSQEYLLAATASWRDTGKVANLVMTLQNLADCLGNLGRPTQALEAAAEALSLADQTLTGTLICTAMAYLAWAHALGGDTQAAESNFAAADHLQFGKGEGHLYSIRGVRWADFLARTGRSDAAMALTKRNRSMSLRNGWHQDVGLCDQLLGRLYMASGDQPSASRHLTLAAQCFRDGDYLVDLATTLVDLADYARLARSLDAAQQYTIEALSIASPRGLVPLQAAALTARARIFADLARDDGGQRSIALGRDAADAALRLSTRRHYLPWSELSALSAHAQLDDVEGKQLRWASEAASLRERLVPAGFDPDPLDGDSWPGDDQSDRTLFFPPI
jgi:tetratricopeptide (TPR) repeat protein